MRKAGTVNWVAWIVGGAAALLMGIPALWMYMDATATPVHPNPQDVPSTPHSSAPLPGVNAEVEQARQIIRNTVSTKNWAGLSVAVALDDQVVWAEGFGFADTEKRTPVKPNHRFRIGTASIVLTSAAAGLLIEENRLKVDEPVQTYVPAFPAKEWPVTLRQVMGHLAGLRSDGGDEGPLLSEQCERPTEALEHFGGSSLLFQPGTKYRYSRYGWILVSAAIEAAAQKPFLTFMRERVFEPLAMHDTGVEPPPTSTEDRVSYYFPRFAGDPGYGLDPMRDLNYSCYAGAGVFVSTPSDLVRFAIAMGKGRLLKPATVQLLQTSQRLASGEETGYGLGWEVETATLSGQQTKVVGHDGDSLGGMISSLMSFPEHGIIVAILSNTSYADTSALGVKIAESFVGRGRSRSDK